MTCAETNRTAKAAERKRKRDAGLVPLEVWVPASKVIEVREAIAKITAPVANSPAIAYPKPWMPTKGHKEPPV